MTETMKLKKFRVENFRSVNDSGWIDADTVTSLIGINESGKSNLLIPLWKLNPAKGGEINPLSDFPRSQYNNFRAMEEKPNFITAVFELSHGLKEELVKISSASLLEVSEAEVSRDLGGKYFVSFPKASPLRFIPKSRIVSILDSAKLDITKLDPVVKAEDSIKANILEVIEELNYIVESEKSEVGLSILKKLEASLSNINIGGIGARSTIGPRFGQLTDMIKELATEISQPSINDSQKAKDLVIEYLPTFVYYSNYGNLDSEIFLPHVIQNMKRDNLGSKEEAKARTLKVLFDFVRLKPEEILELGQEAPVSANTTQLEKITNQKREHDILLQSASTELTKKFKEWWRQGDYRFRFAADGNHFRIWVSDDKRPDDIELEGRSTGLQWFLSFFLVFLVEAKDSHDGCILLLDEPGLTLHPLAQKDLSAFFDGLSGTNQLIYSTHSPFLIDSDKLDRVRAVYVDEKGFTSVSANLRAAAPKSLQEKSIYAAHAALGLSVSEVLLQGCQSVIVEGISDQYYLNSIKGFLIGKGLIVPSREIIFIPSGGVRGVKAVAAILTGKEEELPHVVLDSDNAGLTLAKQLQSDFYASQKGRVLNVGEMLDGLAGAEIEDLLPKQLIADVFSREYRANEVEFSDIFNPNECIVPQMEAFASKHGIVLLEGWKVDLAKAVKRRILAVPAVLEKAVDLHPTWVKLFEVFTGAAGEGVTASPIKKLSEPASIVSH